MTNLEKLEKEIRTALPRLMELSEGCRLVRKVDGLQCQTISVVNGIASLITAQSQFKAINTKWAQEYFNIIGHDILLSDVFEWNYKSKVPNFVISSNGAFTVPKLNYISGEWDLSKPKLNQQSQELIDFLVSLIK